ncbi:unnamed protein product [Lupinus luteus]|uniref:RNase H type-1 domain-containing protein n=1 Tax=Lupinus luteus TaxID=3873 RepID=A0AAV1XQU4_LUPLU
MVACGGAVRDHLEAFIFAFTKQLGHCSAIQAELWGILIGMRLFAQRGFRQICIEIDSKSSVQLITVGCVSLHPCAILVTHIHSLFPTFQQVYYGHDLAKYGLLMDQTFRVFDVVPSFCLINLLLENVSTVYGIGL